MLNSIRPVLHQLEADPRWTQFRLMQTIHHLWPGVVGDAVAKHTSPLRLHHQTLQVATSTAAWAQNLSFQRHLILTKLNPQLKIPIKDIRFLPAEWHRSSSPAMRIPENRPTSASSTPRRFSAPPPTTPEEALDRWRRRVQQVQQQMVSCPQCGHPCPSSELKRWSICSLCQIRRPHPPIPGP